MKYFFWMPFLLIFFGFFLILPLSLISTNVNWGFPVTKNAVKLVSELPLSCEYLHQKPEGYKRYGKIKHVKIPCTQDIFSLPIMYYEKILLRVVYSFYNIPLSVIPLIIFFVFMIRDIRDMIRKSKSQNNVTA